MSTRPPMLRLTLTSDGGTAMVVRASLPGAPGEPEGASIALDPSYFGLPLQLSGSEDTPTDFRIPEALDRMLADRLEGTSEELLCLQLVEPFGYLGLVPWEALLTSRYGVTVVRVPTLSLTRRRPRKSLQVAILAAVPSQRRSSDARTTAHGTLSRLGATPVRRDAPAERRGRRARRSEFTAYEVDRLVRAVLRGSPRPQTNVHVITTPWIYHDLRVLWRRETWPVTLHNPFVLRDKVQATDNRGPLAQTPWLRILKEAQGGEQADVVHVLCHAKVSDSSARLVLADPLSTSTNTSSRYISMRTMMATLDEIGAWSFCLTAPTSRQVPSLRYLASRLAELRPGPVLLTDLEADPQCAEVEAGYRFMFGLGSSVPPTMRYGMVTCEPHQIVGAESLGGLSRAVTSAPDEEPRASTEAVIVDDSTPMWVAAAQRFIEQRQIDLARLESQGRTEPLGPEAAAIAKGIRIALVAIQERLAARTQQDARGTDD